MNNRLLHCMLSLTIIHMLQSNLLTKAISSAPMSYDDYSEWWPPFRPQSDLYKNRFFDRVVAIFLLGDNPTGYNPDFVTVAPGILFKTDHVLTSFNPFRKLSKHSDILGRMRVSALKNRHFNHEPAGNFFYNSGRTLSYETVETNISCARQVMPIKEEDLTEDQWFGTKRLHSPVHDLMVMRVKTPFATTNIQIKNFDDWPHYKFGFVLEAGPSLSELAQPGDYLGREVKFASIGFMNNRHIWHSTQMVVRHYSAEDNIIVNCERWFPRDWGYFICIKNIDKFEGVGSGAILVYDEKVFGIGSFLLEKASESILVFTDVRKYADLIEIACTYYDGGGA